MIATRRWAIVVLVGLLVQVETVVAERNMAPDVRPETVTKLVEGNTAFAFDLYQQLRPAEGNLLFSPYSVSQALAMTYAGAEGATETQMASALHFTPAEYALNPAFDALDLELRSRGENARGMRGQPFKLHIVNALWGEKNASFLKSFTDVLDTYYGAGLRLVDFKSSPDAARRTINDWVAEQTEDKIKDLFPAGSLTPDTRLVLTNAIYFNAAWQKQFKEEDTKDDDFHPLTGATVQVPMMNQTERLGYAEHNGTQAVELPYDGGQMTMVVLLPKKGDFEAFETSLDADKASSMIEAIRYKRLKLSMPRFEYASGFQLNQQMKALGMVDAFDPSRANFAGMTGQRDLFIGLIVHKAYILLNEQGTEAAAATGVGMMTTSLQRPQESIVVKIDRPFLYLIRDRQNGTVLFIGRVLDPRA